MAQMTSETRSKLLIAKIELHEIYSNAFDEWHNDRTEDGFCRFTTKKYKRMKAAEKALKSLAAILKDF